MRENFLHAKDRNSQFLKWFSEKETVPLPLIGAGCMKGMRKAPETGAKKGREQPGSLFGRSITPAHHHGYAFPSLSMKMVPSFFPICEAKRAASLQAVSYGSRSALAPPMSVLIQPG